MLRQNDLTTPAKICKCSEESFTAACPPQPQLNSSCKLVTQLQELFLDRFADDNHLFRCICRIKKLFYPSLRCQCVIHEKKLILQFLSVGVPGQVSWMPAPQVPMGCPQGLEYLSAVDQILIHQQVDLVEGSFVAKWFIQARVYAKPQQLLTETYSESQRSLGVLTERKKKRWRKMKLDSFCTCWIEN